MFRRQKPPFSRRIQQSIDFSFAVKTIVNSPASHASISVPPCSLIFIENNGLFGEWPDRDRLKVEEIIGDGNDTASADL
ncbi:hypothetical protein [Paenibacillus elgii]|uniref:hypothetical protein n=1 Tax=Paenibacillus elgii TaxID=189691 RepID=UPI0030D7916C